MSLLPGKERHFNGTLGDWQPGVAQRPPRLLTQVQAFGSGFGCHNYSVIDGPVAFIGDVHGWSGRLAQVLKQLSVPPVFLGDLIDRGPDAPAVLTLVHELVQSGRGYCVLGNHEFALVRGLGVPQLGIDGYPDLYDSWYRGYGGRAVCDSYGVPDGNQQRMREALGPYLPWMAQLPWVLQGRHMHQEWIAVHAGLTSDPWRRQVEELQQPQALWQFAVPELPGALYSKRRTQQVPNDLPKHMCVVSGHTPVPVPVITRSRILCDTTGGLRNRKLSAVCWPDGRVVTSG